MKKGLQEKIENLSEEEQRTLLRQLQVRHNAPKIHEHFFSDKHTKILVGADLHIGHKEFDVGLVEKAAQHAKSEGVEAIYLAGDILEGMSGRDGHIYELSHIGAQAQIELAAAILSAFEQPIFAITGNHDGWYKNKGNMGLVVGEELSNRLDNFEFLGEMEADVMLAKNTRMRLFHPADGTAYATSYKLQKLIESFTGGDKPNIVLEGHYHKSMYAFTRNTHGFECGTFCGQTPFMRGKKIPAHKGYWILDIFHNKTGVDRIKMEFVPDYD